MDASFDYFLILGGCAFALVVWLLVRTVSPGQGGDSKRKGKKSKKAANPKPRAARTTERIYQRNSSEKTQEDKPAEPVLTTLCFTDGRAYPFAVATLTADFWIKSDRAVQLPQKLLTTLNRYLPASDNSPARLLQFLDQPRAGRPIVLRGFDEKGNTWTKPLTAGLKTEDFKIEAHVSWETIAQDALTHFYRAQFRALSEPDQAALIALENHPERLLDARPGNACQRALRALILKAISVNKDRHHHFKLLNAYFVSAAAVPSTVEETELFRLTISQTFAQTQKLPFLVLLNTTSGVQCYNALNY